MACNVLTFAIPYMLPVTNPPAHVPFALSISTHIDAYQNSNNSTPKSRLPGYPFSVPFRLGGRARGLPRHIAPTKIVLSATVSVTISVTVLVQSPAAWTTRGENMQDK
jgi:hypothetical protein